MKKNVRIKIRRIINIINETIIFNIINELRNNISFKDNWINLFQETTEVKYSSLKEDHSKVKEEI